MRVLYWNYTGHCVPFCIRILPRFWHREKSAADLKKFTCDAAHSLTHNRLKRSVRIGSDKKFVAAADFETILQFVSSHCTVQLVTRLFSTTGVVGSHPSLEFRLALEFKHHVRISSVQFAYPSKQNPFSAAVSAAGTPPAWVQRCTTDRTFGMNQLVLLAVSWINSRSSLFATQIHAMFTAVNAEGDLILLVLELNFLLVS